MIPPRHRGWTILAATLFLATLSGTAETAGSVFVRPGGELLIPFNTYDDPLTGANPFLPH